MHLRWQVKLQVVSDLRLVEPVHCFLSDANLHRVDAVLLHSLYLCDLASIKLDNCAWDHHAPLVPKVRHADFDTQQATSLAQPRSRFSQFHR